MHQIHLTVNNRTVPVKATKGAAWNHLLSSPFFLEIEKIQRDDGKDEEKFIDVVINKNMKLGQKVLIPVKQFPKVSDKQLHLQRDFGAGGGGWGGGVSEVV